MSENARSEAQLVNVDRRRWLRGTGTGALLAAPASGNACVVGFWCLAEGLTEDDIAGWLDTQEMERHGVPIPDRIVRATDGHNPLERIKDPTRPGGEVLEDPLSVLCHVNDASRFGDERREALLLAVAPHLGIRLRFTGQRLPPFWRGAWGERSAVALAGEHSPPGPFEVNVKEYRWSRGRRCWDGGRRHRTDVMNSAGDARKNLAKRLDRLVEDDGAKRVMRIRGRAPNGRIVFDRYREHSG